MRPVRRQRLRRPAGYPGIRPASGGPRRAYGAPCALTAAPPRRRVSRHPPGSDGHRMATDGPQRLLSFMYNFSDCLKKEFVHKQCTVSDFQPD